jgi:hypothetical protein
MPYSFFVLNIRLATTDVAEDVAAWRARVAFLLFGTRFDRSDLQRALSVC